MGNIISNRSSQQAQEDISKQGPKSWAVTENTLSGPLSFLIKEHVQCLCEGGKTCSREDPARQDGANAVPGLHSNWVGDKVLAMARPWQENVAKYDLVSKFKELGIGMILNLQEIGEHDGCGPGNLPSSGFTYSPEPFMADKIGFYNLNWRDMGVPTLDKMMDIVQVMHYTTEVEHKKVAVHCHAGLGRTGLAIACFMVASGAASAAQAVALVRQSRPGSLQTKAQEMFVYIFEQYLQHLRCLFKVADLQRLNLGNEGYILTKLSRRISRSMSAHGSVITDPVGVATAALSGSGAAAVLSASSTPKAAAALQPVVDEQADWANASYEPMSAADAAQLPSAAEAAANAMLDLKKAGASEGVMLHARRLSGGGGSLKLVCNLKAINEEKDKPVHVIETETAVTEVYGDGLTIIRCTQSSKKLPVMRRTDTEEQLRERLMPTTTELGLDHQAPWNEKFHIKPEAFSAEGWLPEPPATYQEALKRQQRLLHGVERRQSLRLHRVVKAAAKALTQASMTYNAVQEHWDSCVSTSPIARSPMKRTHTRSRSSAAADLLAVTSNLGVGSSSSSSGGHSHPGTPSKSFSSKSMKSAAAAAATAAAVSGLSLITGPHGTNVSGTSLLPGIFLGAPGTSPCNSAASTRASSGNGAAGDANSHSNCLAGCCAPSFAAGLLAALIYKGRFPQEYELQWTTCPRLQALGFAEGHAMCSKLHAVKLALNSGDCQLLESASAAVAIIVLGDWFEGFTHEALSEISLQMLIDAAEALLEEAKAAAAECQGRATSVVVMDLAKPAAVQPQQQSQQHEQIEGKHLGTLPKLKLPHSSNDQGQSSMTAKPQSALTINTALAELEDDDLIARKALARAVCSTLAAYEQDLLLTLAAVLRHVRHASMGDSRLHSWMVEASQQQAKGSAVTEGHDNLQGHLASAAAALGLSSSSSHQQQGGLMMGLQGPQQHVIDEEVDATMAALYKVVAGWLLGPMAIACQDALTAVAAFLQYLTLDDVAFSQLLVASREQGLKKSQSQPGRCNSDSLDSLLSGNSITAPTTPYGQVRSQALKSAIAHGLIPAPASPRSPRSKAKSKLGFHHSASSPSVATHGNKPASSPSLKKAEPVKHSCPEWAERIGCAQFSATSVLSSWFSHNKAGKKISFASAADKSDMEAQTGSSLAGGFGSLVFHPKEASSSQLDQHGQGELCVSRQKERATVGPAADLVAELAHLNGRQQASQAVQLQQSPKLSDFFISDENEAPGHASSELTGAMGSPPKSISPVPPTSSRGNSPPRHHLPAIRPSAAGAAAVGLSGAAAVTDPCGASKHVTSDNLSQGHYISGQFPATIQQPALQSELSGLSTVAPSNDSFVVAASTASYASAARCSAAAAAAAQGAASSTAAVSTMASSIDLGASNVLSISALSDLQLPSFASSISVAESWDRVRQSKHG